MEGNYVPLQCFEHDTYGKQCWCVDSSGQEMKGTRVNNGTIPECGKNSSLVYSFPQYKIHCVLLNLFKLLSFSLRVNQHFCLQKEANVPVFQGTVIANDTGGLDVSAALLRRSPRFWLTLVLFCFLVEASL